MYKMTVRSMNFSYISIEIQMGSLVFEENSFYSIIIQ